MEKKSGLRITWLGHAAFKMESPGGKTLLVDPWLRNNPACPQEFKSIRKADLLLLTHGHSDHFEDALDLARSSQMKVVANWEICTYLKANGATQALPMNKGGSQVVDGIRVTMVPASHTSSIQSGDGLLPGGEAVGFVVEFENGFKLYDAGDTAVFGDMKLIADLYEPDLTLLPIGDRYTMGPKEAALACRLLRARKVLPMHYGTSPALTGRPEQLRELTRDLAGLEIISLKPGEAWSC